MSGFFKASAVLGAAASCRQVTKSEQKSSWGSFWTTV